MGDIAITLVDLAQQDLLRVEETDDGADWLLTPSHGVPARQAIAEYETKLLAELADGGRQSGCRRWRPTLGESLERSGTRWSMRW